MVIQSDLINIQLETIFCNIRKPPTIAFGMFLRCKKGIRNPWHSKLVSIPNRQRSFFWKKDDKEEEIEESVLPIEKKLPPSLIASKTRWKCDIKETISAEYSTQICSRLLILRYSPETKSRIFENSLEEIKTAIFTVSPRHNLFINSSDPDSLRFLIYRALDQPSKKIPIIWERHPTARYFNCNSITQNSKPVKQLIWDTCAISCRSYLSSGEFD
jgi:hypothetical protein